MRPATATFFDLAAIGSGLSTLARCWQAVASRGAATVGGGSIKRIVTPCVLSNVVTLLVDQSAMTSYFSKDNGEFVPRPIARSPWAADMLHGRLLGGLAARSIEHEYGEPGWRFSRLTVDLFRPAAMEAVQITTTPIRQGRRVQVIDALMSCAGHVVGRATAVLLRTGENPPGTIWRPEPAPWPAPESVAEPEELITEDEDPTWLFRVVQGGFQTGVQSRVWTNETAQLVEGEELGPLARAAVSGDIACPLATSGTEGLFYINADYTVLLARYPIGDWVGIEVAQQLHSDGISIASATLVDEHGPFATSSGSSLVRPPLEP